MNRLATKTLALICMLLCANTAVVPTATARTAAKTAPAFNGCTRITLREFLKTSKAYLDYGEQIILTPYSLSRKRRLSLARLVNGSRILTKVVPDVVKEADPEGHFTVLSFEFGPRSHWTARIAEDQSSSVSALKSFIRRYGTHIHAVGPLKKN